MVSSHRKPPNAGKDGVARTANALPMYILRRGVQIFSQFSALKKHRQQAFLT